MPHPHATTDEVAAALSGGRAVVALESTLVTHGLPWPVNLETARRAERAVREAGAVPATIAVVDGRIRVGLADAELERIARPGGLLKASRRDLAWAIARGLDAGTTVSATLWIARSRGVAVMATGGLGGVHRDASRTYDISTDLDELASAHGQMLVCSGFKSILDLPATLETLETRGVAVVGYRTDELPAFTTPTSGLALEHRVDAPGEAATLLRTHRALGLSGAIVLAQPAPAGSALDRATHDAAVEAALDEARRRGVAGKALTPFLLDQIRARTGDRSLAANADLIEANAGLAGRVAAELAASGQGASGEA